MLSASRMIHVECHVCVFLPKAHKHLEFPKNVDLIWKKPNCFLLFVWLLVNTNVKCYKQKWNKIKNSPKCFSVRFTPCKYKCQMLLTEVKQNQKLNRICCWFSPYYPVSIYLASKTASSDFLVRLLCLSKSVKIVFSASFKSKRCCTLLTIEIHLFTFVMRHISVCTPLY